MAENIKDTDILGYYNSVRIGKTFKSYNDILRHIYQQDLESFKDDETTKANVRELFESYMLDDQEIEKIQGKTFKDTSVGGNDAINPYWQFCEDDDIVHPVGAIEGTNENDLKGMGRVYEEVYDKNQQLLHLTFGVPHYNGIAKFFMNSSNQKLSTLMREGDVSSIYKLGATIGYVGSQAILLPITGPIAVGNWIYETIFRGNRSDVSKYVDFEADMFKYYRFVDTILNALAIAMGFFKNKSTDSSENKADRGDPPLMHLCEDGKLSIFEILDRRARRIRADRKLEKIKYTDKDIAEDMNKLAMNRKIVHGDDVTWFSRFIGPMLGDRNFVRFKLEKSENSSESFSNNTGESQIGTSLKAAAQNAMSAAFSFNNFNLTGTAADEWIKGVADLASGAANTVSFNMLGGATEMMAGHGMYDIPHMWTDSSFSKSYSFSLSLRARYGDPLSIFQSIYIPLACLLAGALPRAIGKNMYTSPFLVRAYCKGLFAIPYGIIDSITIKRGATEFGWTHQSLPTCIDVDFSIKDLTPIIYLGLADQGKTPEWVPGKIKAIYDDLMSVFRANDNFIEYLNTLSGLGLADRYNWWPKLERHAEYLKRITLQQRMSPIYWTNRLSLSGLGQSLGAVFGWGDYQGNN